MSEDFNFSLDERTFDINIAGQRYVIVEASEESAKRYKNTAMRATKFSDKGKPSGVDGLADVEPLLVSMCLFKVDEAGMRTPVQLSTILRWPHRVVAPIYQKARELSGLKDDEEDKTGPNSPTATTTG